MLNKSLEECLYLTQRQKFLLIKAGIKTVRDFLWYFPGRYEKLLELKKIAELRPGDKATIAVKVLNIELKKTWRKKIPLAQGLIQDENAILRAVWFNQPYIAKILKPGENWFFSGQISADKNGLYIANPTFEKTNSEKKGLRPTSGGLKPLYPSMGGISSRWFCAKIQQILKAIKTEIIEDFLPPEILKKYHLPSLKSALFNIHQPKDSSYAEASQKRFSFEEIFLIQLSRLKEKILKNKVPAYKIDPDQKTLNSFIKSLPFKLTKSQTLAIKAILKDLKSGEPMTRLLEGDVGSGKTMVAIIAALAVIKSGFQTAYMAPTEILAYQVFSEFISYFKDQKISIGLLTSSRALKFPSKISFKPAAKISRTQLLKWLKNGEIDILVGTHSLISEKVSFKKLALVIVDEQHRFGVKQRASILRKETNIAPHFLSMTATPIPRTLALTVYGDLDLTLIEDLPPERKRIETIIAPPEQRNRVYEMMRIIVKEGRQAYVICPRIELKEAEENEEEIKAVKTEHQRLKNDIFPEFEIGFIHGKLLPKEKENVFKNFKNGTINILVSTSLVEVGVNVPNATMILIEGAERFGLAQLHQMRGRVLRSTHQPYCFIFYAKASTRTLSRLKALIESKNGFELAEYDLKFRGPGSFAGFQQWGVSDTAMKGLQNLRMVEAARIEADELLKKDFELRDYPLLKQTLQKYILSPIHPE